MKTLLIHILLITSVFFRTGIAAQTARVLEHQIESEAFGGERSIRVFLPERYFRDSTTRFAVTYILDGQYDPFWDMAKHSIGYMVTNYSIFPMIVVGVVSENRGSDFRPPAKQLRQHFEKEVFPLVEENYRTENFRTIVGHSWGGAFVGSTLFSEDADLFDAYIGISPVLGYGDDGVFPEADSLLRHQHVFKKYVYCSSGDVGRRELEFGGSVDQLDSLMQLYPHPTLVWKQQRFEGKDHWSCVIPSIGDGLISMSRHYFADQKVIEDFAKQKNKNLREQIKDYNNKVLTNYGFVHRPSANFYRFVADDFLELEQYEPALELYQLALEISPDDVKATVGIADLYDKMHKADLAREAFQQTIDLLERKKADMKPAVHSDLMEWAKDRLAQYE